MKAKLTGKKLQTGISTLEMLIALAILVVSVSTVIAVVFGNQSITLDAELSNQALNRAQAVLEAARASARDNFLGLSSATTTDTIYTKDLVVQDLDQYTKKVTSRVSWQTESRLQKVELTTIVTDYHHAFGADTCSQTLSGDWTDPQLLGSFTVSGGNQGTDIDVFQKKAYLITDSAVATSPDLYILNVTDSANPAQLSVLNTGPGLRAIRAIGNYAFVANSSINAQLQVLGISNPSSPSKLKDFKVGSGSGLGVGNSIFYVNNTVYLGLTKGNGQEFNVIDVTDPLHPVFKGGYETNTQVNAIWVSGKYAYLTTPATEELTILDVSNSANIVRAGGFDAAGGSGNGKSLYLLENKIYLGRTVGNQEFYVLEDSNPATNLPSLGFKDINNSVNDLIVRSALAFLLTPGQLKIFDASNPSNITQWGSFLSLPSGAGATMDCELNLLYIAQHVSSALQIIGPK